jgi:hypothetical protein
MPSLVLRRLELMNEIRVAVLIFLHIFRIPCIRTDIDNCAQQTGKEERMKNLILTLSCMIWFCAAALSQNTRVSWWAFTSGFKVSSNGITQSQGVVGQSFVGSLQGTNIRVETGFLSNPLISGGPPPAATFTVTTVNDTGHGSLRWAIESANTAAGLNTIAFNIPGSGVQTIAPVTPLPSLTDPVIIDGYTQPGASQNTNQIGEANNAVLRIQLTGPGPQSGTWGLVLRGGNSVVRGLIINRFETGILLDGVGGNTIQGNFIGTDSLGSINSGNRTGVRILSPDNTIGGSSPSSFNIISANVAHGIRIDGNSATNNLVLGNYLGTTSSGNGDLTNGAGVWLEAPGNFVGGATLLSRNIILGGNNPAIILPAGNAGGNAIRYNFVGTNASGTAGLGAAGIYIYTPNNIVSGNVISGNLGILFQDAAGNIVQGNLVGLSADGTTALANNATGIQLTRAPRTLIGGLTPDARNVITVLGTGINISSSDSNTVQGNYIGTNAAGTVGLIPGGAAGSGISITASTNNLIGGAVAGARNTIANSLIGINITAGSRGNIVQGNFIGTNASGTAAIPNRTRGVGIITPQGSAITRENLIGGHEPGAGNVISGNVGPGIWISGAQNNTIRGNSIGLAANGTDPIPNSSDGIQISFADSNMLGGQQSGAGNRIAFNGVGLTDSRANGIKIFSGRANTIHGNSIFSNTRLGIDLVGGTENLLGVTSNDSCDADSGPNNLQNYPRLGSVIPGTNALTIHGTLNSAANSTFLIEFFSSPTLDTSGHGGARDFLGSTYVTTGNSCLASFEVTLPVNVPLGHYITSTATDSAGNTSEFSLSRANGTVSVSQREELPTTFALGQNYPNPFNPSTKIKFSIPVGMGHAPSLLRVYDVLGREVATLVNENLQPGSYEVTFSAAGLASGVYFYRLKAGEFSASRRMIVAK